eukprot:gene4062-4309_t
MIAGMNTHMRTGLAWLTVFLALSPVDIAHVAAQGLDKDPDASYGSSLAQQRLQSILRNANNFRARFKNRGGAVVCRYTGDLMWSAAFDSKKNAAVLSMAWFDGGNASMVQAAARWCLDKQNATHQSSRWWCANYNDPRIVLHSAVDSYGAQPYHPLPLLLSGSTEQDFFFCKSVANGEERTCSSSWQLKPAVEAFIALINSKQYPVLERCMQYDPSSLNCAEDCQEILPDLKLGTFTYVKLDNIWDMQEHIRNFGSVVAGIDIYDDFLPFFSKTPGGVYLGHGAKAKFVTRHAIQIVGYDNIREFWLCKNSYGADWGSEGYFRVAFGADGVADPGSTFGIKFKPFQEAPKPFNRLSPAPDKPGCFWYRAQPSDFVSRVAYTFAVPIQQVLLDNMDVFDDNPDMPLVPCAQGQEPWVCQVKSYGPWESCNLMVPAKPLQVQLCYADGVVYPKRQTPTCDGISQGSLALQGR